MMFIMNAFVGPTLWWVNIPLRILNYKRGKITQEKLDQEVPKRTQRELNKLFENPNVDFAFKFSYISKTILMTFFFAPLLPGGLIISFLGLIYAYFIEKYNMVKIYKRPDMPNEVLAEYFMDYFKVVLFVFSVK
jgi:hypothetical protein